MRRKKTFGKNLLVSCSGGETSTLMAHHINESPLYKDYKKVFVFANTSIEHPRTYEFLKESFLNRGINLRCIEGTYSLKEGVGVGYREVKHSNLNQSGLIFVKMIFQMNKYENKGVPNYAIPYSSSYLKERPITKFAKDVFNNEEYITAIGYRLEDMPKRITWAEIKHLEGKKLFPMLTDFEMSYNKERVIQDLQNRDLVLGLSKVLRNCCYCYKADLSQVCEAVRQFDKFVDLFVKLEKRFGNNFFRDNSSMEKVLELIRSGTQLSIDFNNETGCYCSM